MLEVLLRGAHAKEETRRQVALLLRCPIADIGWAKEGETHEARFLLDHLCRQDGFRTQVTLCFDAKANSPIESDQKFARALAASFEEDALVLEDPIYPATESFHGLLMRPDGKIYRVPLHELPSGGMGIEENGASWSEWKASPK